MKDPYEVLGVPQDATTDEIKRAYRRLARERHPDTDPGNPWAEDEFKELSAAYDTLSDPAKRARVDRMQAAAARRRAQGRPAGAGSPFERFFYRKTARGTAGAGTGTGAGAGAEPRASAREAPRDPRVSGLKVKGADVSYTLKVDFLEAVRGARRRVTLTQGKALDVTVPPGTETGQVLRLKGQGMAGLGGGGDGDALVEIEVSAHPVFRRDGIDIRSDVAVSLPEAVLGGRAEVDTIDGMVALAVPAGSNSGTVLRLRGKGVRPPERAAGDHYVTLKIVLPSPPDKDLVRFVEKWAAKNPYEVRRKTAIAEE